MMTFSGKTLKRTAIQAAAFAAVVGACATASAQLPQFTLDPSAGGLTGAPAGSFTADNILISDYSTVTFGAGGTFTDTGYLAITGFQLGGTSVATPGLDSTYGLYIAFTGHGTTTLGNLPTQVTSGSFSDLSFTLYGYSGGPATFTPSSVSSGATTTLATGSLQYGAVATFPSGNGKTFVPTASAALTFTTDSPFFVSPSPFYDTVLTSFVNTTSEVKALPNNGGFTITQGGGSLNFVSTVPEPGTYGLMLAGLGVVAFVARRRSNNA